MSTSKFVIIFAFLYLAVCFGLSIYASKKSSKEASRQDFYVASSSLGSVVLFLTAMATAFSAFAFMGQLGQVYNFGSSAIFNFMHYGIFTYPLMFLIGSKLWYYGKRYGYVTPADFIAHRYDTNVPARVLVGLVICVYFSVFYIVIQMKGCSWALQEATGMSTPMATLLIAVVLGAYVAIGGMRAVAYTDVVQAIFLIIGALTIAGTMIFQAGGISELYTQALIVKPEAFLPKQNMTALITGGLVMALSMPLWPALWTKYYCAKDLKTSYNVATGCGLGTVLVTVGLPLIIVAGLIINYPNWPAAQADSLVIRYVLDFTHPLVASIVVGGLLSAAMSTADALLLLISSVFTVDITEMLPSQYKERINEKSIVSFGRIMVFVIIAISFWISLRPMGQLVNIGIQLTYPGYLLGLPIVVGGLWWKKANKHGLTYGLIAGVLTIYYTTFVVRNPMNIASGLWGLAACTIVFVVVSIFTAPTRVEILKEFGLAEKQSMQPVNDKSTVTT